MRGSRGLAASVALAVALGACGGARQDEDERAGTYRVEVVGSSFPERQEVARQAAMTISVRNADRRTVPNLAVTVDSFGRQSQEPNLASAERPVWILDREPRQASTTYTNTWALGPLRPGEQRTLTWHVTPVRPGFHRIRYRLGAGLHGKAKAQTPEGGVPEGSFTVEVEGKPARSRVDPETGKVVRRPPRFRRG